MPDRETWFYLPCASQSAAENMAWDETLLESAPRIARPVLRFYGWREPAASFGYFQQYAQVADLTSLRPLIRRPTGGGLVPHERDWTYALVFPPGHPWYGYRARQSYAEVHRWVQSSLRQLGLETQLAAAARSADTRQCFAGAVCDDLLWHGAKIAGAAQRRTRAGLLIQGSVQPPRAVMPRADWEAAMREAARSACGVQWERWEPDAPFLNCARRLATEKYSQTAYNARR
jgi:lipoate-protein ligase A